MRTLLPLLFLLSQPWWETIPPQKWTDQDLETLLTASPWAKTVGEDPPLQVYFATAEPIEQALAERRARSRKPLPPPDPDYVEYLQDHREDAFVLAIPYPPGSFGKSADLKRLDEDTVLKIGKKRYRLLGHFPPTAEDPVLRLVFPRVVKPTDNTLEFELYLPGVSFPERNALFQVNELMYKGNLAI